MLNTFLCIISLKGMLDYRFTFYKTLRYNSLLEVVWNILPILCLCWIAIPSFSLLYMIDDSSSVEFIIRIMGNQWYWTYEFTLNAFDTKEFVYEISDILGNFDIIDWLTQSNITFDKKDIDLITQTKDFSNLLITVTVEDILNEEARYKFDSRLLVEEDLISKDYGLRLLEVDQRLPLLKNITTCFLISSTDVLHSWAIPSFGVKSDACPGRLNRIIVSINRLGIFYGQCSEICGIYHAFMPIVATVTDSIE